MRCGIYSRFSSDLQKPTSIEDQERKCREFAAAHQWLVIDDYVKSDAACSGTALLNRNGLADLRLAAKTKPAPLDVLLVEDTSRLARNLEDVVRMVKTLVHHGVHVIGVTDGFDTRNPSWRQLLPLKGMMDEGYVDALRVKTHRGLEGQVLRGRHAGGRCFGYTGECAVDPAKRGEYGRPGSDGVLLRIDPQEATIVRRIFEMSAEGMGISAIAKALNREGVPAPRPRRGKLDRGWCPSCIREMLLNERYRGVHVWNKHQRVQDPETGRKSMKRRDPAEWLTTERPEWRIVSEELWLAVQRRREFINEKLGPQRLGGMSRTERSRSNLFSGLMVCGTCGSHIVITHGGGKCGEPKYGCPTHRKRGTCSNRLVIRKDRLEDQLLGALERRLLQPRVIETVVSQVFQMANSRMAEKPRKRGDMPALKHREAQLGEQAERIGHAIALGGSLETLVKQLGGIEAELKAVRAQILAHRPATLQFTRQQVQDHVTRSLLSLRTLMSGENIPAARAALQTHIPTLVFTPVERDGKPMYRVSGEFDLGGRDAGVIQVVAGEGFEPSTFGL